MINRALAEVWTPERRAIITNAGAMVGATAVTSALGFIYWWVAARFYTPSTVGIASANISAMTLLGTASVLGFGTLLMSELPRHPGKELPLVTTALLVTGGVGWILGIAFALAAPLLSPNLGVLDDSLFEVLLFATGVALTTMTLVLDKALIGLLRGGLQLWRNTIFATTKLVALILAGLFLVDYFGTPVYATWVLGNIISLAILAIFVVVRRFPPSAYRPQLRLLRALGRAALVHHGLNLSLQIPNLALPLVVTVVLSATINGYFYTAWLIGGFVFTGAYSLALVLFASSSSDANSISGKIRFTLTFAAITGVLANIVLFVCAGWILSVFGRAYAENAQWALRVIGLGVFPLIIKDHYAVICRLNRQVTSSVARVAAGGCLELVMAVIGAHLGGLVGVSIGWVFGVAIEATLMANAVFGAAGLEVLPRWWPASGSRRTFNVAEVHGKD